MDAPNGKKHTLMLDARRHLVLTGVEDVSGFNEETVSVKTTAGSLTIKGSGLHIDRLNLAAQSAINFAISVCTMLPIAYICYWMEHSITGVLQYMGIFACIYGGIWAGMYGGYRANLNQINRKIQE